MLVTTMPVTAMLFAINVMPVTVTFMPIVVMPVAISVKTSYDVLSPSSLTLRRLIVECF